MLRAIRDPAIGRLWAAMALAALADQSFAVVLSWVAVGAFGSAAGYLAVLQAGVGLAVALLLGHLADRVPPLGMMSATMLLRAAVLAAAVAAWLVAGAPPGWVLVLCVAALSAGLALFRPALQAALPGLAREAAMLPPANALLDTTDRIARLLGPGLLALSAGLVPLAQVVGLEALGFLAAAGLLALLARRFPQPAVPQMREPVSVAALRGVRALRRHPLLGFLLLMTAPMNGAWYAALFLGVPLAIEAAGPRDAGGAGLAAFGLVIAAYGGANLLATLVVGNRRLPRRADRLIFAGYVLLGGGIVGMGAAVLLLPDAWLLAGLLAGAAVSGVGGPMMDVPTATIRQTDLPRRDLPAAVRAYMVANWVGMLAVLAVAPGLFDLLGVGLAVALCGAAIVAMGLAGLVRRDLAGN